MRFSERIGFNEPKLELQKESMDLYLKTKIYSKYAMDVHWHILQGKDNWFIHKNLFCDQIISYSDIEKYEVDYKDCYQSIKYV